MSAALNRPGSADADRAAACATGPLVEPGSAGAADRATDRHDDDAASARRLAAGRAARHYGRAELAAAFGAARAALRVCIDDLSDAQWLPAPAVGVNPVAWEAAHVAWFAEFWTRRGPHRHGADCLVHAARPPLLAGPDALLDSARLPHAARWSAPLPDRGAVLALLDRGLDDTLAALAQAADDDAALYPFRLALLHEDMHVEALAWQRATGAQPAPHGLPPPARPAGPARTLALPGGVCVLGQAAAAAPGGFAFDNECPGRHVTLAPFAIDAVPVSAGQFAAFVDAGGYAQPAYWPGAAGRWRAATGRDRPARWRRAEGGWQQRVFDRWVALADNAPVVHVNAWEAEAYCRWAGRRLPLAAEWEIAATQGGLHWGGSVWEWTALPFLPYPGFVPGPYRDYSAPWFQSHREVRGGSVATADRLHHPRFRNFFAPERNDVGIGFRTCAA